MRYVDYGNSEITLKSGLVHLPASVSSMDNLCHPFVIGDVLVPNKDPSSESFEQGALALCNLVMEQKIHAQLLTTDRGTGYVIVDKIDDKPIDLSARLLSGGHVCSKNIGPPKVPHKPPPSPGDANKAKRVIFTPDKDSDTESPQPKVVDLPQKPAAPLISDNPGDGHMTYAEKMISKMETKSKKTRPISSPVAASLDQDMVHFHTLFT